MTPQCGRSVVQFLVVGGDILYETKVKSFYEQFCKSKLYLPNYYHNNYVKDCVDISTDHRPHYR